MTEAGRKEAKESGQGYRDIAAVNNCLPCSASRWAAMRTGKHFGI